MEDLNMNEKEFFKTLFPDLESQFIEVRDIHPSGDSGAHSRFYSSLDQIFKEWLGLLDLSNSANVYFGVCPRFKKERNKEAINKIWTLWVDLDSKMLSGGKEEALKRLKEFPLPPTAIVDSGNGYHAYWRLKEAEIISSQEDIARVEGYLKALATALGADLQSAELARILRVPGTKNHKDPGNLLPVQIVALNPAIEANLSDFQDFLEIQPALPKPTKEPGWLAKDLSGLTEGNRNSTFAKITGKLHSHNLNPEDILILLKPYAEKCGFPYKELKSEVEGITRRYPLKNPFPISPYNSEKSETDSKPMVVIPLAQFMKGEDGQMDWIVDRILPREAVGILAGPAGYGKSWLLLDLAIEMSRGGKWLDKFSTTSGRILYLDEESSETLLRKRFKKLLKAKGLEEASVDVHLAIGQGLRLSELQSVERLRVLLKTINPTLVIVDSLIRVHSAEENSAKEMAEVFGVVKGLVREFKCSFLFADHQRKPGHFNVSSDLLLRGSTEKVAFIDSLLSLQRKENHLIVDHSKSRHDEAIPAFIVRLEDDLSKTATRVYYAGEAEGVKQQERQETARVFLTSALNESEFIPRKSIIEKAKDLGISEKVIDETLKLLEEDCQIEREDRKPELGRGGKSAFYKLKNITSLLPEPETEILENMKSTNDLGKETSLHG